ncbi:MAG TPA: hypothetical protein VND68_04860, partial [Chloroflexia bacterium]|nr:hypothetical protein [Chloroflexia bacterium]
MAAGDIDSHPHTQPTTHHGRPHTPLRNGTVSAAVVVGIGLAIFFGWRVLGAPGAPPSGAPQIRARVGSLAPDFELKDVNTGQMVKLSDFRGRPVWVNFWA